MTTLRARATRATTRASSLGEGLSSLLVGSPSLKRTTDSFRAGADTVVNQVVEDWEEIQHNETVQDAVQMIGPMRTIQNIASSDAVSTFANVGLNVLGNVMHLSRSVLDAAEEFAAPENEDHGSRERRMGGGESIKGGQGVQEGDSGHSSPEFLLVQTNNFTQRLSLVEEEDEDDDDDDDDDDNDGTNALQRSQYNHNQHVQDTSSTPTPYTFTLATDAEKAAEATETAQTAAANKAMAEAIAKKTARERMEAEAAVAEQEMLETEALFSAEATTLEKKEYEEMVQRINNELNDGGIFHRYVLQLEDLCSQFMNAIINDLKQKSNDLLYPYMSSNDSLNVGWWSRHDAHKHTVEYATPTLSRCLPVLAACRRVLTIQLSMDLFRVIWMRLAEHVDRVLYNGIVRGGGGHRFRDVGVQQLTMDHERLCEVFRTKEDTLEASPFPLLSEALMIFHWGATDRERLIEALEQLSRGEEVEQYINAKYEDEAATAEQRQMHDMLRTKGIYTMHPEHVLFVSSLRL
tara:strand:- start:9 stop:1568 length:1560 start_codon:yes stop_codon:yes gene_type:complete